MSIMCTCRKLDYEKEKKRVEVVNDPAPRKVIEYVEEKCYALLAQGASQEEVTKASQRAWRWLSSG